MLTVDQRIASICSVAPEGVEWDVAIISHEDGRPIGNHNAETVLGAASLAKLGIAYALQQERIALNTQVFITPEDRRPGPDMLPYLPDGYGIEIGEVVGHMLQHSSNTGARLVTRYVGGAGHVNEILGDAFPHTQLEPKNASARTEHALGAPFYYGTTTPLEIAELMRLVIQNPHFAEMLQHSPFWYGLRGDIEYRNRPTPHESISTTLSRWVAKHVTGQKDGLIHRAFYEYALKASSQWPTRTPYPNKEGSDDGFRHDVALIGPYIVAACSVGYPEKAVYDPIHRAHTIHRKIGELALTL